MRITRTLMIGVATSLAFSAAALTSATAQSNYATSPYLGGYGFEGFYAGVLLGGMFDGTSAYLTAPDVSSLSVGLAVGVNFYLTENIVGGLEVQGGVNFGATANTYDALGLAKLGFAPGDDFLVYATAGVGAVGANGVYAFGGGVEAAVMESISVRGELLGIGQWGATPNALKATVGLIWRMQ